MTTSPVLSGRTRSGSLVRFFVSVVPAFVFALLVIDVFTAGLGTLPMQAPELAIQELKRCLSIGLVGVEVCACADVVSP